MRNAKNSTPNTFALRGHRNPRVGSFNSKTADGLMVATAVVAGRVVAPRGAEVAELDEEDETARAGDAADALLGGLFAGALLDGAAAGREEAALLLVG